LTFRPDPKPIRRPRSQIRIVNPAAIAAKTLSERACRACGVGLIRPNGHHLVPKGSPHFGDDVEANIIPLCGSGTTGCHGRVHDHDHAVLGAIGAALHDDEVAYVLDKMGVDEGSDWLMRRYRVIVPLPEEDE
jgi:hypothetical protein